MTSIRALMAAVLLAILPAPLLGQAQESFANRIAGLQKLDGYFPVYWDQARGRLMMEISRFGEEFLYQVSLPAGIGSNPITLDRGQLGPRAVVRFERIGPKVLLVQPNYRYRALGSSAAAQQAVADSFATSVLWGFTIDAAEGSRVLVDATAFFLRDAHGVGERLHSLQQGRYRTDDSRSAVYLPRTKAFPRNTEVEVTLTLVSEEPSGPLISQVTPTPGAVTVREHHSLVQLPGPGYTPRRFDPRVGLIPLLLYDYGSPITSPLERRWVTRHRLVRKDPAAARSEPVEPIVYYVDPAAPEPIRQALIDGASWWNAAFDAAGYVNAFQVKTLPADADPMDIRYNVINWVHRATRGWSYGDSVVDPRTGEIIKGNVTLGSLRVRQNVLIDSALTETPSQAPRPGAPRYCEMGDLPDASDLVPEQSPQAAEQMALARLRQLAAHEVGHTLGLEHNFAASTYGRGSVMDYPAPLVTVRDGRIDVSRAYASGIGVYDAWAIRYGYTQFPDGIDEDRALASLLDDGIEQGLLFVDDDDARPAGAGNALASLWDNGSDPVAALREQMEVRKVALDRFGLASLPDGLPLSLLEARLLPVYLHHRYQLQAAAKALGGAYFAYSVKTAAGPRPGRPLEIVPADRQRAALAAILDTLEPAFLALPARITDLIPPPAFGFDAGTPELFARAGAPFFDPLAAATVAADLAVSAVLQPQRAARLVQFHVRNARNPTLGEVFGALVHKVFMGSGPQDVQTTALRNAVQSLTVTRLIELAGNTAAVFEVRAEARAALRRVRAAVRVSPSPFAAALRDDIDRFLAQPGTTRTPPPPVPAGEPIGG